MSNNNEEQIDKETKVTRQEKQPEKKELSFNQRKLLSFATLKELLKTIPQTVREMRDNPHLKELPKLYRNQVILTVLALSNALPGIEVTDDLTGALAIIQKGAKAGKKAGFFASLYKDVPKGLQAFITALDLVGTPLAGATDELWQMTANQLNIWKEKALADADWLKVGFKNVKNALRPKPEVIQARQQFI